MVNFKLIVLLLCFTVSSSYVLATGSIGIEDYILSIKMDAPILEVILINQNGEIQYLGCERLSCGYKLPSKLEGEVTVKVLTENGWEEFTEVI